MPLKTIRKSMSDVSGYLQIANAVRKGQKIQTIDKKGVRTYEIIINR